MNRVPSQLVIILPIFGLTTPLYQSQAQPLDCNGDQQCLEESLASACEDVADMCLTWLRRMEEHNLAGSPQLRLITAEGYFRVADLTTSEDEVERYREQSRSILQEVLQRWPDGNYANQAYTGLANLSFENIDQRISLMRSALQAEPGNENTTYLLAISLAERGDYGAAADMYRRTYAARGQAWYSAANALELYARNGQTEQAAEFRAQIAKDSGMEGFEIEVVSAQFSQDLERASMVLDTACHRYIIIIFGQETCSMGIDTLVTATRSVSAPPLRQAIADVASQAMGRLSVSGTSTADEKQQRDYQFGLILQEWIGSGAATAPVYVLWAQNPNSNLDEGIAAFERAVELAPGNGRYRYWLAQGYAARGRYDEAIEHLNLARDTLPENVGLTPESVDREIRRAELARNRGQ